MFVEKIFHCEQQIW